MLITKQELHSSCTLTPIVLTREALEQLDDRHYAMAFPLPTKIKTSCGQEQFKTLQGSFLAVIPYNCYLSAPGFTITNNHDRIKGRALKILELPHLQDRLEDETPPIKLISINLQNLHDVNTKISLQSPIKLEPITDLNIYHTTIPIYTIVVIVTALLCRRIIRKKNLHQIKSNTDATSQEIYVKIGEEEQVDPKLIKVHHKAISATTSSKVRQ